jgi:hypothetical protein
MRTLTISAARRACQETGRPPFATIPVLLKALGHTAEVPIGRDDYGNVFLLFPRQGMPPVVVRFHY